MSAFGLGDQVRVGKSTTTQTVAGIATEKDSAGVAYLMVTVASKSGKESLVEGFRLVLVKRAGIR